MGLHNWHGRTFFWSVHLKMILFCHEKCKKKTLILVWWMCLQMMKPLNPVKNGKLSRVLMETSKLDNQQKGILKCAPKNNFWTTSCAIKKKTLISVFSFFISRFFDLLVGFKLVNVFYSASCRWHFKSKKFTLGAVPI